MKNKLRVWCLEEFDDGEWGEYYDDNGESL